MRALVWESTRELRARVLGATAASCALAALLHRVMTSLGDRRDRIVFVTLFVMLLIVNVATVMGRREGGGGLRFERRLFRMPVSSALLVSARFAAAMLAVSFMVLAVGLFMRLVVGAQWPVIVPWLITLACLSWLLALGWTLAHSNLTFLAVALPSMAVLARWVMPRLRAYEPIAQPSAADAATLLALVGLAYSVAVLGVGRDRRGTPVLRLDVVRRLRAVLRHAFPNETTAVSRAAALRAPFGGPLQAQVWMDWREKGWMLPVCAVAGVTATCAMGLLLSGNTERAVQSLASYPLIGLLLAPPVVGFLYGRFHGSSDRPDIDPFRARRPLRDDQLAKACFAGATLTLIATWLAGAVSVASALLVWRVVGDAAVVDAQIANGLHAFASLPPQTVLQTALGVLGLTWTVMGTILALTLAGRNWVTGALAVIPVGLVGGDLVGHAALGVDVLTSVLPVIGAGLLAAAPIATIAFAAMAWKRGFLSTRLLGALASGWLLGAMIWDVSLVSTLADLADARFTGLERLLALASPAALCLPILPVALAPLAVQWNRHR